MNAKINNTAYYKPQVSSLLNPDVTPVVGRRKLERFPNNFRTKIKSLAQQGKSYIYDQANAHQNLVNRYLYNESLENLKNEIESNQSDLNKYEELLNSKVNIYHRKFSEIENQRINKSSEEYASFEAMKQRKLEKIKKREVCFGKKQSEIDLKIFRLNLLENIFIRQLSSE